MFQVFPKSDLIRIIAEVLVLVQQQLLVSEQEDQQISKDLWEPNRFHQSINRPADG